MCEKEGMEKKDFVKCHITSNDKDYSRTHLFDFIFIVFTYYWLLIKTL